MDIENTELVKFKEFCDKHAFILYEKAEIQEEYAPFRATGFWTYVPEMTDFSIMTNLGTKVEIYGTIGLRSVILTNIK